MFHENILSLKTEKTANTDSVVYLSPFAFAQNNFQNHAFCSLPWRDVDDSIGICRFLLFSEKGYFHEKERMDENR